MQRRTASILQRLNRTVIPPLPLVDRLAAHPVSLCRPRYPVLRRIFQYPLTIVRFLCYPKNDAPADVLFHVRVQANPDGYTTAEALCAVTVCLPAHASDWFEIPINADTKLRYL